VTARRRRPFANGQFMMFRREAYLAVGGHEAVRGELLEDLALGRLIAESGRAAGLFVADGMVTCRMYDSWEQFRRGWKRIYTEAAKCKVKRLKRAAAVSAATGAVLPVLAAGNLALCLLVLTGAVGTAINEVVRAWAATGVWLSGLGLLAYVLVIVVAHRMGRAPMWSVAAHPIGAWLVSRILAEAARDLEGGVATRWGGREYVRVPR
jgi:hypothetical protein